MPSLCQNPDFFMLFQLSIIVLGIPAAHFLEMTIFNAESNENVVGNSHSLIWSPCGVHMSS